MPNFNPLSYLTHSYRAVPQVDPENPRTEEPECKGSFDPSKPADVFKHTQYGRLWQHYSNHDYFHESHWTPTEGILQRVAALGHIVAVAKSSIPRKEMLQRVVALALIRLFNISADAALNFASGLLTYQSIQWWKNRNKNNSKEQTDAIMANGMRLLADPNIHALIENAGPESKSNYRSHILVGLLTYGIYSEIKDGSNDSDTGTNLAIATQLGAAITAISKDLKELALTLTPTTLNDIQEIYKCILTVNDRKKTLANMPLDRKEVIKLLKNEIDKRFRGIEVRNARRHGEEIDVTAIEYLLQTLDMHIEIYERSIQPVRNIWLYDKNSPDAQAKQKDIALREKFIFQQISQEEKSQKGMEFFLTRMRLQSSPTWEQPEPGRGLKTSPVNVSE